MLASILHRQARVLVPPMLIEHDPQMPSRHDRRKVSVGSSSFLILIRASSTIGPHLRFNISKCVVDFKIYIYDYNQHKH